MKHTLKKPSPTQAELTVTLEAADIAPLKAKALNKLAKKVKVPGFRPGKTPVAVAEKHLDQAALQQEVLETAVNQFYIEAMVGEKLQPLDQPDISVSKFVPDQMVEFTAKVEIVPEIKLADYKKIKKTAPKIAVKADEVNEVIERLRTQMAEKKQVERAAKDGDEVLIDFAGKDTKGEAVNGATGKDYPLALGSKTFIDGFEENLVGMKTGEEKTFTLTFPKDYAHKPLANKDVVFTVTVKKVLEAELPALDDAFAKKVGPFETVADLKKDIKQELERQKEVTARGELKNEIMEDILKQSDVPLPKSLVEDQARLVRQDVMQNLAYRGQTLKDYLEAEGLTEEEWTNKEITPAAEKRVATGLILSEVAKLESIQVSDEESTARLNEAKQQYQDPKMRAQLDTPEARRDITSRLATEKTLDKLIALTTATK